MLITLLVALVAGITLGVGFALHFDKQKKSQATRAAQKIVDRAMTESDKLKTELSKKRATQTKKLTGLVAEMKEHLSGTEKRVSIREKQADKWQKRIATLANEAQGYDQKIKALNELEQSFQQKEISLLEEKTGLTADIVVKKIEEDLDKQFQLDFENYLQRSEQTEKDRAVKKAKRILQGIMYRYTEPSSVDRLESTVKLSRDLTKGKLIGKAGKYINYFEKQTRVAVIFNDSSPLHVTVSCFHLLRREIARRSLISLAKKSKINEETIDEAIAKATEEIDKELVEVGRWAADIIELPEDKRDPKLLRLMGRLKYRTSYGQNILYHSLEIAFFSAMMAAEIGADVEIARLGGFFHDLGKAIDQDDGVDKPHDHLSKDILEEHDFSWEIVHAAWTHHDAIPIETIEAEIVKAADAISAGRPGARSESAEDYYARISALEEIVTSYDGVQKVFAMSAGRELRTFVDPKQVKDDDMLGLAEQMRDEIEENVAYPGKVKVNLVRTVKSVDYAKEPK